jgi:hypothetical protein
VTDSPADQLDVLTGNTVLVISGDGTKTLVSNDGSIEDVCETLA